MNIACKLAFKLRRICYVFNVSKQSPKIFRCRHAYPKLIENDDVFFFLLGRGGGFGTVDKPLATTFRWGRLGRGRRRRRGRFGAEGAKGDATT
jgi:hypothetical protein